MDLEIKRNLAHLRAYDMIQELKSMYSKQAKQELLQTMIEFQPCKQEEGQSVSLHVLKIKGYTDNLERHGQLVGKIVNELQAMLKLHEETLPKKDANAALHAIRAGKTHPPPKKDNPTKDAICHQCAETSALSLYVGDGYRAAIEAIGTYNLELPSGLVIVLNNCHYAPSITRDVISLLYLFEYGFINHFDDNNVILVSKNNLVYFMAVPQDDIFEIDMSCSNINDSSIKKRIKKFQHDGLLNSIGIESLGMCVSCMSGKMARKPNSHQVEMAKDLLGLIHTDVFQKEVENQLRKTIKSLHSDRGCRYMCQEFLDHLKEDGITFHRTPPYTPQNNKMFKRRNQTLLDMVRSMMSQTTLPKSFWDYALETVARILNLGRAPDHMCLYIDAEEHELRDLGEPANYKAALLDLESKKWLDAVNVEMQSMKDNVVWVLVELPPNSRTVGSKCLFKKKTNMDGAIYIFKARLVAKGFTQTYRVDYEESFSPVADIRAIRILISIATYYDYAIWQIDVKTSFLKGHISKEVYMEQHGAL
uniref:Integrase catalytic domain-containing protein n=1 Tax=Tanacetum cinerariifolium TaxID=118510 RepID=A0A6L2NM09_TANCI|nr:hypothetical protein [Tanacetum cinerariifolium]